MTPPTEGYSKDALLAELRIALAKVEAHYESINANTDIMAAYNRVQSDYITKPHFNTPAEMAAFLVQPYRDFMTAIESGAPVDTLYERYRTCDYIRSLDFNVGHYIIDSCHKRDKWQAPTEHFTAQADLYSRLEVAQQVKQLMDDGKAVTSKDCIVIPKPAMPQGLESAMHRMGMIAGRYPGLLSVFTHLLKDAAGHDIVGSRSKAMEIKRRDKISGWWKDDFDVMEFARGLPTYTPLSSLPASNVESYRQQLKEMKDYTAGAFLNDPALAKALKINVDKLREAVDYTESLCRKLNIPAPTILVDPDDWNGGGYEMIQVSQKALEILSPRAIKALMAHELAHVILNHAFNVTITAKYGLSPGELALYQQQEIDADLLGNILSKDPMGLVEALTSFARADIHKARKEVKEGRIQVTVRDVIDSINHGITDDYHPAKRVRIHQCREMSEEMQRAQRGV